MFCLERVIIKKLCCYGCCLLQSWFVPAEWGVINHGTSVVSGLLSALLHAGKTQIWTTPGPAENYGSWLLHALHRRAELLCRVGALSSSVSQQRMSLHGPKSGTQQDHVHHGMSSPCVFWGMFTSSSLACNYPPQPFRHLQRAANPAAATAGKRWLPGQAGTWLNLGVSSISTLAWKEGC